MQCTNFGKQLILVPIQLTLVPKQRLSKTWILYKIHVIQYKEVDLLNTANDPEERHELSAQYPDKMMELLARRLESITLHRCQCDIPRLILQHHGIWVPWKDTLNEHRNQTLCYR